MKIVKCNSYEEISRCATNIIVGELMQNKSLLLCAATGGSPTGMYEQLVDDCAIYPGLSSHLRIIKLDEWGGIPMQHPGTCEQYLQANVIKPLQITPDRYISFESNPQDPEKECSRIQSKLNENGPIDICILGLGMNGHIALNEPAPQLHPHCHVATLTEESLQHPMIVGGAEKPGYGLTLGVADIMQSKLIILLINGSKKREIAGKFRTGDISSLLPASLLQCHPNVICLIDKDAAGDLKL